MNKIISVQPRKKPVDTKKLESKLKRSPRISLIPYRAHHIPLSELAFYMER